ncbi:hypothetical protein MTBLM5_170055 [Magnetospirillum sp. LM-5]|uniref:hypothetical protein n=1 Tax=Magnetospirillum sp. LM-5 TaxID=2681466 RepID=UPI00137EBCD1|nr:hypothetical protein [Magnetospirillum sp. LM-5]CAA7615633.1 hypothetical protein MTBLM5_170055 [Magnetospirillum sp. LM-5]
MADAELGHAFQEAQDAVQKALDALPLSDRWAIMPRVVRVTAVRTSAYIDEEIWSQGADGNDEGLGLSGQTIEARIGHVVSVVTVFARNSGRTRPVLLYNHGNGLPEILTGNFAPLLRSPFEKWVLIAGGAGMIASFMSLPWLSKVIPRPGRLGALVILAGGGLLGMGIAFPTRRRRRLRHSLDAMCRMLIERLVRHGRIDDMTIDISPESLPQS